MSASAKPAGKQIDYGKWSIPAGIVIPLLGLILAIMAISQGDRRPVVWLGLILSIVIGLAYGAVVFYVVMLSLV